MTKAIFEGLVFDEQNHPATVAYVGSDPTYVIIEDGFRFHVDARSVDDLPSLGESSADDSD